MSELDLSASESADRDPVDSSSSSHRQRPDDTPLSKRIYANLAYTDATAAAAELPQRNDSGSGLASSSLATQSTTTLNTDVLPPPFGMAADRGSAEAPAWRKILYARQPFEDNYIDPSLFLQDMRANANVPNYDYFDVVKSTFAITQQISIVVLFVYVFAKVFSGQTSSHALLYIDVFIFVVTWVLYVQVVKSKRARAALDFMEPSDRSSTSPTGKARPRSYGLDYGRQGLSVGFILLILSPIMRTLTAAYSDDTIVAMSIISMSLSVLLADYRYLNGDDVSFTPSTSENAATFGVVLMASRIPDAIDSGSLVAFGALCFTISLIARRWLRRLSFTAHVGLTFLLFGLAAGCLVQIPILAVLYVMGIVLTNFVVPWAFVTLHSSVKYQINGPWDEARPTNSAAAAEWARAGLLA